MSTTPGSSLCSATHSVLTSASGTAYPRCAISCIELTIRGVYQAGSRVRICQSFISLAAVGLEPTEGCRRFQKTCGQHFSSAEWQAQSDPARSAMSMARRARTCCKATLDMAGLAARHNAEPCSAGKSAGPPAGPSRLDNPAVAGAGLRSAQTAEPRTSNWRHLAPASRHVRSNLETHGHRYLQRTDQACR